MEGSTPPPALAWAQQIRRTLAASERAVCLVQCPQVAHAHAIWEGLAKLGVESPMGILFPQGEDHGLEAWRPFYGSEASSDKGFEDLLQTGRLAAPPQEAQDTPSDMDAWMEAHWQQMCPLAMDLHLGEILNHISLRLERLLDDGQTVVMIAPPLHHPMVFNALHKLARNLEKHPHKPFQWVLLATCDSKEAKAHFEILSELLLLKTWELTSFVTPSFEAPDSPSFALHDLDTSTWSSPPTVDSLFRCLQLGALSFAHEQLLRTHPSQWSPAFANLALPVLTSIRGDQMVHWQDLFRKPLETPLGVYFTLGLARLFFQKSESEGWGYLQNWKVNFQFLTQAQWCHLAAGYVLTLWRATEEEEQRNVDWFLEHLAPQNGSWESVSSGGNRFGSWLRFVFELCQLYTRRRDTDHMTRKESFLHRWNLSIPLVETLAQEMGRAFNYTMHRLYSVFDYFELSIHKVDYVRMDMEIRMTLLPITSQPGVLSKAAESAAMVNALQDAVSIARQGRVVSQLLPQGRPVAMALEMEALCSIVAGLPVMGWESLHDRAIAIMENHPQSHLLPLFLLRKGWSCLLMGDWNNPIFDRLKSFAPNEDLPEVPRQLLETLRVWRALIEARPTTPQAISAALNRLGLLARISPQPHGLANTTFERIIPTLLAELAEGRTRLTREWAAELMHKPHGIEHSGLGALWAACFLALYLDEFHSMPSQMGRLFWFHLYKGWHNSEARISFLNTPISRLVVGTLVHTSSHLRLRFAMEWGHLAERALRPKDLVWGALVALAAAAGGGSVRFVLLPKASVRHGRKAGVAWKLNTGGSTPHFYDLEWATQKDSTLPDFTESDAAPADSQNLKKCLMAYRPASTDEPFLLHAEGATEWYAHSNGQWLVEFQCPLAPQTASSVDRKKTLLTLLHRLNQKLEPLLLEEQIRWMQSTLEQRS